jgi:two-component system chemotaxis response regulator CheB
VNKIRVLVVDDSVVIRRLLTDVLGREQDIEVVGTAPNGRIALAKLPHLNPDLVTLDVEMPEMDGLETLPHIRKMYPALPVVMFSTLTSRGATATLDALSLGASDYVAKPANVGSVTAGMQSIANQLVPLIRSLCPRFQTAVVSAARLAQPTAPRRAQATVSGTQRCDVLLIGSSTGGPTALNVVLRGLPADFPIGVLIVQHMPPVFTRHLAERLNQDCALAVNEAKGGEVVEPGKVLIAPGDFHLALKRDGVVVRTELRHTPPENSCRPAVDVLFRTAAETFGGGCLAAVLTGMGQDGLRGSEHIAAAGGTVVAQDQATCVVWGMPRAVTEAGLAQYVRPLPAISAELVRLAGNRRRNLATV